MANNTEANSAGGITIGFIVGLTLIYGLEMLIGYLENLPQNTFNKLPGSENESNIVSAMHGGEGVFCVGVERVCAI